MTAGPCTGSGEEAHDVGLLAASEGVCSVCGDLVGVDDAGRAEPHDEWEIGADRPAGVPWFDERS